MSDSTAGTPARVQQTPDERRDGDLSPIRAQILACFLAPEPTSSFDLRDRAIMVRNVAEFMVSLDGPRTALALALTENMVRTECAKMRDDGLVLEPAPNIMDHHKPPPDTYILTPGGEALAWAVLEKVKEAKHGH